MLFRQLFDSGSGTYTYLIASKSSAQALLIDPVLDNVEHYLRLLHELDLKLVKAVDTHIHADHVTALGVLRDETRCITVMGRESAANVVGMRIRDGESIAIEGLELKAIYTPGHTDCSYCFHMGDRVFTGDTLMIRGTGRTDFQNGDPYAQYDSIFNRLLTLPEDTMVFPGHDYKGDSVSTIREERAFNPRLQVDNAEQYAAIMKGLGLANPKMMDVAVPANCSIGAEQLGPEAAKFAVDAKSAKDRIACRAAMLVDLREAPERERDGEIEGTVHADYARLEALLGAGGPLRVLSDSANADLVFISSYGERSMMAAMLAQELGLESARHIAQGVEAWQL